MALTRDTCRRCDSTEVIHLVMGMPTPEAEETTPEWVHFGGCVGEPGQPDRRCETCGAAWTTDEETPTWAAAKLALGLRDDAEFLPFVAERIGWEFHIEEFPTDHEQGAVLRVEHGIDHADITFPTDVDQIAMALLDLRDVVELRSATAIMDELDNEDLDDEEGELMVANGIFCLEGEWEADLRERPSVKPVLELLERLGVAQHIHRDVSTVGEVGRYLRAWDDQRYDEFRVLSLVTHGDRNGLEWSPGETTSLRDLAAQLGDVARGCYVHVGGCSALRDDAQVQEFVASTGVKAVVGYRADVGWIESAGFEVVLLSRLTEHASEGRQARTLFGRVTDGRMDTARALKLVVATSAGIRRAQDEPV
ncbi:MAG TPA: hypothetical protein VGE77_10560 [Nocardioides sp.]